MHVCLRPSTRRSTSRAAAVAPRAAHRPRDAQAAPSGPVAPAALQRSHGDDQRAVRRGRRSCGARPSGR
jgi:hypothetical protein